MSNEKIYPIKVVSNRTGLSMHVIRAWEKRYGVVKPQRTDTNRRLYSSEDIQKLQLLNRAVGHDYKIGTIANLNITDLKELISEEANQNTNTDSKSTEPPDDAMVSEFINNFINNVSNLDYKQLSSILTEASIVFSNHDLLIKVLAPTIFQIGEKWRQGEIRVSHEHLATLALRDFLTRLRNANEVSVNAPGILIGTPRGNVHELGALLIAALAAIEGWKVTYLGPDLPAEDIISAANKKNTKVVCLSIVYPYSDPVIISELTTIASYLPKNTFLIVGGRAASSYKDILESLNAKIITDLNAFREALMIIENTLSG